MNKIVVSTAAVLVASLLALAVFSGAFADMFTPAPRLDTSIRLIESRKFAQAEQALRSFLKRYPDNPQARLMLAELLIQHEEPPAREILSLLSDMRNQRGRVENVVALVVEGQAHELLHELDLAESCYRRALARDPRSPPAVWWLSRLFYLEGRSEEDAAFTLRLASDEPQPLMRAQFLREHLRHEVQRLSPTSIVQDLEAPYRLAPASRHLAIAYGRALVRDGELDKGLAILKANRDRHGDAESWHAYFVGLDQAGDESALKTALSALPRSLAGDPRFAGIRGQAALNDGDYPKAVAALEASLASGPPDRETLFRLERALRLAGETERAAATGRRLNSLVEDRAEQTALYNRLAALDARSLLDSPDLLRRLAALRRRLGHPAEAVLWDALADEAGKSTGR